MELTHENAAQLQEMVTVQARSLVLYSNKKWDHQPSQRLLYHSNSQPDWPVCSSFSSFLLPTCNLEHDGDLEFFHCSFALDVWNSRLPMAFQSVGQYVPGLSGQGLVPRRQGFCQGGPTETSSPTCCLRYELMLKYKAGTKPGHRLGAMWYSFLATTDAAIQWN